MVVPEETRNKYFKSDRKQSFVEMRLSELGNWHYKLAHDTSLSPEQNAYHAQKSREYAEAATAIGNQPGLNREEASLNTLEELGLPDDILNFARESYSMAQKRIDSGKL